MSNKDYIFIKEKPSVFTKIFHKDITHIRSDKDYCKIYTAKQVFHINIRLDKFTQCLPPDVFYRCHRCFIVNVDRIENISSNGIYINLNYIPVSKGSKVKLLGMINYVYSSYENSKKIK